MINLKPIAEAISAALFAIWAVWTEIRLRQSQSANEVLTRRLDDATITANVKAESDSQLQSELKSDISGGSPGGS